MASTSLPYDAFKFYDPSSAACIIFIAVFGILLIAHVWQSVKAKIVYMWPLILSLFMEYLGYILRYYEIKHPDKRPGNIVSQVLIIIAPACLAAELYMLIGRAMIYVGSGYSLVRPSWITPIFFGLDLISIATQAIGSTILFSDESDEDKLKKGRAILIVGLFVQLVAFTVFLVLAIVFDRRITVALKTRVAGLRHLMNTFYMAGALILVRSVYRAIEFITVDFSKRPVGGFLFTHEWPYYVLDAFPIALSIALFNFYYPTKYLPKEKYTVLPKEEEINMVQHYEENGPDRV